MGRKRWRTVTAKPGELKAAYGRVDGDLCIGYAWGGAGADKSDARILGAVMEDRWSRPAFPLGTTEERPSLIEELEARGYDITTLKFSIQKKEPRHDPS